MGLKVYGTLRSRTTRTVWMCEELGISYERIPVVQGYRLPDPNAPDAPLNTASAAYRKINPNGRVPAIDDDGLVMCESLAINLYLAKKHGGPLAARDPREEALLGMWSLWGANEVERYSGIIVQVAGKDQKAVDEAAAHLTRPFAVLDAALRQGGGYLVGGRFTVADLNVAEVVRYAQVVPSLFEAAPAVKAWIEVCHARPAFKKMMAARSAE